MKFFRRIKPLESKIADAVDNAAKRAVGAGSREPLEVVHAIVDVIEREIQAGGRGRSIFPFTHIEITLSGPSALARTRLKAVVEEHPTLAAQIRERLASAGCETRDIVIDVLYADNSEPSWSDPDFRLAFARNPTGVGANAHRNAPPVPALRLTISRGSGPQQTVELTAATVNLGRGPEVRDERTRLVRTNDVVFAESGDPINATVSRCHAHIQLEDAGGEFRIYDDRSERGTTIVRGGRSVGVLPGNRGVRLQTGDQIVLGDARIEVVIG
jgi:pSer/pThr/pTyr-binding forkhead associated (FHA) protein